MTLTDFLSRLEGVQQSGDSWSARCPAHDDQRASLTVRAADDGKVLVKCHAGCEFDEVCEAAGIKPADLFPARNGHQHVNGKPRIVAEYDYRDERGELLFQTVRLDPKDFRQRAPAGKGLFKWSIKGVRLVPFRLPELLASDLSATVWIVEGERDVLTLASIDLTATCNPMGAGKWRDEYSEHFRGRRVVIIADADAPGRRHAESVARSLRGVAASVRIIEMTGGAKDVTEWADGREAAEPADLRQALADMAAAAPEWTMPSVETVDGTRPPRIVPRIRFAGALLQEHTRLREPIIDGILRQGETLNIIAPPKTGKSWLVLGLLLDIVTGRPWLDIYATRQCRALLLDNELHIEVLASRIKTVAEAKGLRTADYADSLAVDSLRGRLVDIHAMQEYVDQVHAGDFGFVALDALYRFLPADRSENDNASMAQTYNALDRYADQLRAGIGAVHHATKGNQSDKSVTDVGAGASAQARASDSHLILRQHEAEGCYVLDAAVRSFPPIEPRVLRWTFPVWSVADDLNPAALKRQQTRNQERQERDDKGRIDRIVDVLRQSPRSSVSRIGRLAGGMDPRTVCRLLGKIEESIRREPGIVKGNHTDLISLID